MIFNLDQYGVCKSRIETGEERLILTMLKEAVDDAVRPVRMKSREEDQKLRCDARQWILAVDSSICGFDWYCALIGINPKQLRSKLEEQWGLE